MMPENKPTRPVSTRSMLPNKIVFAVMVCLAAGVAGTAGVAAAAEFQAVNVTALPLGEREIVAISGRTSYVLRLAANGEIKRFADLEGNLFLESLGVWSNPWNPIAPKPTDTVTVKHLSPTEVEIKLTRENGVMITCLAQPERLKLVVTGPAGKYLLRGRYPCRMEGARVFAPKGVIYPSAGIGVVPGAEQLVIDAGRTRALKITRAGGDGLNWATNQVGNWGERENLQWDAELAADQAIYLSSAAAPPAPGPVKMGLYARNMLRPTGLPLMVGELDGSVLTDATPIRIKLEKPIETVLPGGQLLAALIPTSPEDLLTSSEGGAWFSRFDRFSASMLPLSLVPGSQPGTFQVALKRSVEPGAYRLRLWIVPKSTALPEALGGPKGAVVPYFPGFTGRNVGIRQPFPMGDVLVVVATSGNSSLSVTSPTLRQAFQRGERIPLLLKARSRLPKMVTQLRVMSLSTQTQMATMPVEFRFTNGEDRREFQLDTSELAPGSYTVALSVSAPRSAKHSYTFSIVAPLASGMVNLNGRLTAPYALKAVTRLGVNGWSEVMPLATWLTERWPTLQTDTRGLHAANPVLPSLASPDTNIYDTLTRENMLLLKGAQNHRALSFVFPHSIPEHEQETQRKHLMGAQFGRGLPNFLGLIFDYDVLGVINRNEFAGERRMALMDKRWEVAWATAKARGATDADKPRIANLFHAGIIADLYRESEANLRAFVPGQRHSTSATADHAGIAQGLYLPEIYKPLDFRYLEAWNDQIYPNGAHDMQESFWTSLLRMGRQPKQPVWVTTPTAPQPGTHFRRTLETFARGATGTGYNDEGNAGLAGGWGTHPENSTLRTAQERQTGELVKRYGTWINQFEPDEAIAILYSVSQGGSNFGQTSPVFFAYFTLAQLNRPARLLTEEEIAAGALTKVKALLVVGQTAPLPAATVKAIANFSQSGGKVLVDKNTKTELPGATKLAEIGWPVSLWPQGGNTYHNTIISFPRTLGNGLKAALGDIGRQALESEDGSVLVATKRAGGARLVFVTNNRAYPFAELFSKEEQLSGFYRDFLARGSTYFKDVRVPQQVSLRLRADEAKAPPLIYDVFDGKLLSPQKEAGKMTISLDLSARSGRVLLLVDKPVAQPTVEMSQPVGSAQMTWVVKSAVPLPIRLRVGGQELYRAATPAGSCDTLVAPRTASGDVSVELTELITGVTQRTVVKFAPSVRVGLRELPAVQLWDAPLISKVLQAKNLAVYVDSRQAGEQAAAAELARRLGAELVVNPPVLDYPVTWKSPPAEESEKEEIRQKGLLAWRRPAEVNLQWPGSMTPAPVWNRPVILFGNALNNRLIAELHGAGQLQRPALPEYLGVGAAIIVPVGSPFWHNQHGVVLLCGDETGRKAAFARLLEVAQGQQSGTVRPVQAKSGIAGESFSSAEDGGARAARQQVLGFELPVYPKKLQRLTLTRGKQPLTRLPVLLPISGLVPLQDGVLAAVHSPGRNLALLNGSAKGTFNEGWRVSSGMYFQPQALLANPAGESVVSDGTFIWRHGADGKPRWKMLAALMTAPDKTGRVWVREGNNLKQVDSSGGIGVTVAVPENTRTMSADGQSILVQYFGNKSENRSKLDASLAAIEIPGGKERWRVPNLHFAQAAFSANGSVVACIEHENLPGARDDLRSDDASRLTVIDAANGNILLRQPLGAALDHLVLSKNGQRVIVEGRGFSDTIYIIDVPGGVIRSVVLPEAGIWARALTADERELWVAGASLYRINLETLAVTPVAKGNFVALAAKAGGGMYAGSDENGTVVEFGADGTLARQLPLAVGLASKNQSASMSAWREALLVGSAWLKPKEVGELIPLVPEYPNFGNAADTIFLRQDAVFPVFVTVRIPDAGRYRIVLDVPLPKDQGAAIKPFRIMRDKKELGQTVPLNGDAWKQSLETELEAGVYTITIAPMPPWSGGWTQEAPLRTMLIEKP